MQEQQHLNYILLGSQESMMTEIFERKKSPFYHFGKLMHLNKIPHKDFRTYVAKRLPIGEEGLLNSIVDEILSFTNLHPYYTQQLSAQVWEMITYDQIFDGAVEEAISAIKRLMKAGYIIRVTDYEIEDPFFKAWIVKSCL